MSSSPEPSSTKGLPAPLVVGVVFEGRTMTVRFSDGQIVDLPLTMFPRLGHGSVEARNQWRLIGKGWGVHWPDLDEDLSADGLLNRRPSMESGRSFGLWLEKRAVRQETA